MIIEYMNEFPSDSYSEDGWCNVTHIQMKQLLTGLVGIQEVQLLNESRDYLLRDRYQAFGGFGPATMFPNITRYTNISVDYYGPYVDAVYAVAYAAKELIEEGVTLNLSVLQSACLAL
jgi:hypothetical protein